MENSRIETTVVYVWLEGTFDGTPTSDRVPVGRRQHWLIDDNVLRLWGRGVWPAKQLYLADIRTVGDLLEKSAEDLLMTRGLGHAALEKLRKGLAARGLKLKGD